MTLPVNTDITCLVTTVPVEGESIEIEFTSSNQHLLDNISFILKHGCRRLRNINMMLLDDMGVTDKLTKAQYETLLTILKIQFPYSRPNETMQTLNYNSPSTKILVRKMTNHKEQIALRASGKMTGQEVFTTLERFIDVTSERMIETNMNDVAAYDLLKEQNPEDQMILQLVLDTLYGRIQPEVASGRLQAYADSNRDMKQC